ncbi:MAG: hypothetical protein L0K82_05605 [Pisciglobus halotolerans]|nr:hypothetical protein [Pisciglobus halotolerans]
MKTVIRAVVLFVIFMLGTYFLPQLINGTSPQSIVTKESSVPIKKKENSPSESKRIEQDLLSAEGFSYYIGKSADDSLIVFGEPVKTIVKDDGIEKRIYGKDNKDFFQVTVKKGKVTEIMVLGEELSTDPFKIGMDRSEMYQSASFYPTFQVSVQQQLYQIELSEIQLHKLPLVAFDNYSFGTLYMDSETGEINAIRYFTPESLLLSGLYDSTPTGLEKKEELVHDKETSDKLITDQIIDNLAIFRKKQSLPKLKNSPSLTSLGDTVFNYLEKNEKDESSLADRQEVEDSSRRNIILNEPLLREDKEKKDSFDSSPDSFRLPDEQHSEAASNSLMPDNHLVLTERSLKRFLKDEKIDSKHIRLFYSSVDQDEGT